MSSLYNKNVVLRKRVVDFTVKIIFFRCLYMLVQAPNGFRETFGAFANGKNSGWNTAPPSLDMDRACGEFSKRSSNVRKFFLFKT
jgi:hypothetical protein